MAPLDAAGFASASVALLGCTKDAKEREQAVAIVDPYASGRFLVDELRRRGWPLVAVRSSLAIDEAILGTWNPVPFERVLVHHGDVAETAEALRSRRPLRAVIAGSEPGVELADELAAALGLRGNDPSLPRCRWDKYDMHVRLAKCGLRACRQRLCGSTEDAVSFAAKLGSWPVVAKPRASHGGTFVYLCPDIAALSEAVCAIRISNDFVGRANESVLVQEFLEGAEYIIDCVSVDGRHFVSAAWAFPKTRMERGLAFDTTRALPYDGTGGSVQQQLYAYVFKCLTVLGVQNGASHSEVMYSEDKGPCLIEVSARMHGSMGPPLWVRCAGREQAQPFLVADVYTEDGRELSQKLEAVDSGSPAYDLCQISIQVDLQCPHPGTLRQSLEASAGPWLRALQSFFAVRFFVEEGDRLACTCDLSTSPGFVVLLGACSADVERDAAAIREREKSGRMYILEASPSARARAATEPLVSVYARRLSVTAAKARLREMEAQAEQLLSPICSRAASPTLSPQQAPTLPPGIDELVEFTLDGAEDLDEFGLDGFSLDNGEPPPMVNDMRPQ